MNELTESLARHTWETLNWPVPDWGWGALPDEERDAWREPLVRAYVAALLDLLAREVDVEKRAAASGSLSLHASCRPEWRDDLCARIERVLYPNGHTNGHTGDTAPPHRDEG